MTPVQSVQLLIFTSAVPRMSSRKSRSLETGVEMARKNLAALLERASQGQCSVITRHGKVYAAIVPPRYLDIGRQRTDLRRLRGSGKGLWGKSVRAAITRMRNEWR